MDAFIRALVASAVAGVTSLANAAMERILWLYGVVVAVGTAIRFGWRSVTDSAKFWTSQIRAFASQLYGTLWYIIYIRIPNMVNAGINNVVAWTAGVINGVRDELLWQILAARQWVSGWIDGFNDLIARVINWARQEIGGLWTLLTTVAELVFLLLTDPRRMAKWILAALLSEALLFVDDNLEALLDMVRRKSVHYAGRIAARIEDVLVRLL